LYCYAEEFESFWIEAPIPIDMLQALLVHLGITTTPKYQIKGVMNPGWVEFWAIVKIFHWSMVVSRQMGSTFRASNSDVVYNAAWHTITYWSCRHWGKLQNLVHHLMPQQKKDKFKVTGMKKDIPMMEMVHHQDVTVELSARLLAAQQEIQSLCTQLCNSDSIIWGYHRIVEGQTSNLYAFDTDT
jgi:hypothetical protein